MLSWLPSWLPWLWSVDWNQRTAGWEVGEFGLLDCNRRISRAIRAGAIGKTARKYRRELWSPTRTPWSVCCRTLIMKQCGPPCRSGRDMYKSQPIRARMGASRALINGNIPWEHVTPDNWQEGLGGRYQSIYLPAFISLSDELLDMLIDYVEQGGRVILDMPSAYLDGFGRVLYTGCRHQV